MNSLLNYGSDDDYDDSSEEKQTDWRGSGAPSKEKPSSARETDANYEEVQMDLSEESNDSSTNAKAEAAKEAGRRSRDRDSRDRSRHEYRGRSSRDKERERKDDRYSHRRERDRKSRRSSSREKRRSRTPPRRAERESKRSRSRSRSHERARKYSKRYERRGKSPDKFDPQKSESEEKKSTNDDNRFFMPGISGRFRDQIERRKLLWQKKDADPENKNGQSKKVWETTTFAQDTDGKVANKFKRLMGIKGNTEAAGQGVDVLKKQEEMFSSMEQQYEVARTATHTMRGVGLGFGSYQR